MAVTDAPQPSCGERDLGAGLADGGLHGGFCLT